MPAAFVGKTLHHRLPVRAAAAQTGWGITDGIADASANAIAYMCEGLALGKNWLVWLGDTTVDNVSIPASLYARVGRWATT